MIRRIVDASVAIKWFLDEAGSDAARHVLASGDELVAPAFVLLEIHHALMFAARGGVCSIDDAREADHCAPAFFIALDASEELLEAAKALSWRFNHPVYDCLYVALALRERAPIVTADARQFEVARRAGAKPEMT